MTDKSDLQPDVRNYMHLNCTAGIETTMQKNDFFFLLKMQTYLNSFPEDYPSPFSSTSQVSEKSSTEALSAVSPLLAVPPF